MHYLFSSESVSEGHPDKMADQISDAILDAYLSKDPHAHVACETMLAKNLVIIAGEITANDADSVDCEKIARSVIKDIGYTSSEDGIDPDNCRVELSLSKQSANINAAVSHDDGNIGAGDQGLMFGYATNETPELMPLPIYLAHKLMSRQTELRKQGAIPWLKPDAKAQVTVLYENNRPVCVKKVVLSTQHDKSVSHSEIFWTVKDQIIDPVIPAEYNRGDIEYLINPSGDFFIGGPIADVGLTGRKIIVDTYGGSCPHGGGAFSGKDPTKVDRSSAYMARYVAKNIVASGIASRCTVQIAYAIGCAEPVSVMVDSMGTGKYSNEELVEMVNNIFDLRPKSIIDTLGLAKPIYRKTATCGHFGRTDVDLPWEHTDRAEDIRSFLANKNR
jgi:S-adenosylmethionine synthetase